MTRFVRLLAATIGAAGLALALGASPLLAQNPPKPTPTPTPVLTLTGKWIMALDMSQGVATPALDLVQKGEVVTGFYTGRYGKFALSGVIKGRAVEFSFTMNADGTEVVMGFAAEVAADFQTMKGTADMGGMGEATWSAKRDKPAKQP
jgi:hypothetical protein